MPRRSNPNPPPPDISDVVGAGTNSPPDTPPHSDSDRDDFVHHQPRRDENSISFRHFLQQQSDVVPTRHIPLRNANPPSSGVDLFDVHMGLPDFVQDHLVVEGLGNNVDPEQSLDLSALADCIPVSSHSNRNLVPERGPLSPQSLEDLGACGGSGTSSHWNPLLPDFLSDGPMHCDRDASNTNAGATHGTSDNDVVDSLLNSRNRTDLSQFPAFRDLPMPLRSSSLDVDPHHLERLRRELLDRNRRISELESQALQQEREIIRLQRTIEELTARLSQMNERIPNGPIESFQSASSRENGDLLSLHRDQNVLPPENVAVLQNLIGNSELLARQLTQSLRALRTVADSSVRVQPSDTGEVTRPEKHNSEPGF